MNIIRYDKWSKDEKYIVDKAIDAANTAGAKKAIKLAVSVPSHCSLMDSAAEKLSNKLNSINIKSRFRIKRNRFISCIIRKYNTLANIF